ncbi:hypothetical protein CHS0354_025350 [Potamilus streckersoni]|uniref:Uncharacterized protein n=1 Tax=Potamilus streckersoni TaxID=2493646 RepID=A0AAE0W090_9BIVA|nr:hypothetical protein CHS0354_025350 [Potamilus streckersoni]
MTSNNTVSSSIITNTDFPFSYYTIIFSTGWYGMPNLDRANTLSDHSSSTGAKTHRTWMLKFRRLYFAGGADSIVPMETKVSRTASTGLLDATQITSQMQLKLLHLIWQSLSSANKISWM